MGLLVLNNLVDLLDKFQAAGVKYCHFKSNQHVVAGMAGETDLDILIDRSTHAETVACLVASGFKKFTSKLPTSYPAVDDWLGFDSVSGKFIHLHLHWQLVAGEPNLKGYRIPWETEVLAHRIFDETSQIYVASPDIELLLLLVRASLKYRTRNTLYRLLGRQYLTSKSDILKEYEWLRERVDRSILQSHAVRLLSPEIADLVCLLLDKEDFDLEVFHKAHKLVVGQFRAYRTYGVLQARCYRWFRELYSKVTQILNRKLGTLLIRRRTPATGGLIIALLGADGSGKSTQAKQLTKWLGWKIDVARIYFGSGDGPMSWHRAALLWLQSLLGRSGRRKEKSNLAETPSHEPTHRTASQNPLRRLFKGLYAISLAYEKRSTLRKATRARNCGMIVICDRYPQNQIAGYNDGPLLTEWRDKRAPWSLFARLEQRLLSVFSSVSPDLVIKLNVSEEVSALRKADTPKEMIAKKIEAVRSLRFGPECQVIELDADRPLEDITMAVRSSVWQLL